MNTSKEVNFWIHSLSPHILPLAHELSCLGYDVSVFYDKTITDRRAALGWQSSADYCFTYVYIGDPFLLLSSVKSLTQGCINIVQGIRGNGSISSAIKLLCRFNHKFFVYMESIRFQGSASIVKELVYRWLFYHYSKYIIAVLYIGKPILGLLGNSLSSSIPFLPFAYFLPLPHSLSFSPPPPPFRNAVRFIYIGCLEKRKRVDLLLSSLKTILENFKDQPGFSLTIVGTGPLKAELSRLHPELIPYVQFLGMLPMSQITSVLSKHDVLILPSEFDGWGAAVSEALLSGLTVIASSNCGISSIFRSLPFAFTFKANCEMQLTSILNSIVSAGRNSLYPRCLVSFWALNSISSKAGAIYLGSIFESLLSKSSNNNKPTPPWLLNKLVDVSQ